MTKCRNPCDQPFARPRGEPVAQCDERTKVCPQRTRHDNTLALVATLALLAANPVAGAAQDSRSSEPPDSSSALRTPAVLQAGDVIRIAVWRRDEYSGEFQISGEGTIAHPLYQQIEAAGREVDDVENDLRRFLMNYVEQPDFVVEALFRVPVGGEVRLPDIYMLSPHTTVARAIALAGGPTENGRLNRIILRRDGQNLEGDLTDPDSRLWQLEVRSGDQIVVNRRRDIFRGYIVPFASVVGAIAAVTRLVNRW